jgi:hypothetical protein
LSLGAGTKAGHMCAKSSVGSMDELKRVAEAQILERRGHMKVTGGYDVFESFFPLLTGSSFPRAKVLNFDEVQFIDFFKTSNGLCYF